MIILVAVLNAKPGKENELEAAITSIMSQVEAEEGTLQYTLHRSTKEPGKFLLYEKYADKAALDFHGSTPYLKEFFKRTADLLSEKPTISLYEEIAAIKR